MEALELAGPLEDGGVVRGGGPGAGAIASGEPIGAVCAVEAPDLPDGVVGQLECGGDDGEFLTALTTADDLLADGQGQGAWHRDCS
jgi:hypothetical protein